MKNVAPVAVKNTAACTSRTRAASARPPTLTFDESQVSSSTDRPDQSSTVTRRHRRRCGRRPGRWQPLEDWIESGYADARCPSNQWYGDQDRRDDRPGEAADSLTPPPASRFFFPVFDVANSGSSDSLPRHRLGRLRDRCRRRRLGIAHPPADRPLRDLHRDRSCLRRQPDRRPANRLRRARDHADQIDAKGNPVTKPRIRNVARACGARRARGRARRHLHRQLPEQRQRGRRPGERPRRLSRHSGRNRRARAWPRAAT